MVLFLEIVRFLMLGYGFIALGFLFFWLILCAATFMRVGDGWKECLDDAEGCIGGFLLIAGLFTGGVLIACLGKAWWGLWQ